MKIFKYIISTLLCISGTIAWSEPVSVTIQKSELEKIIHENDDLPATLMSLKILADDAHNNNKLPPPDNLCNFKSAQGIIFCQGNKGIHRIKMPQLDGTPRPGSIAEKMVCQGTLKRNAKNGNVDLEELFIEYMGKKYGVSEPQDVDASTLRATQDELIGYVIASMWWALKQNPDIAGIRAPIFISNDNYIIDGHHRWASLSALEYGAREPKAVMIKVRKINKDIDTLVKETKDFTDYYGIEPQSGG